MYAKEAVFFLTTIAYHHTDVCVLDFCQFYVSNANDDFEVSFGDNAHNWLSFVY